MRYLLDVNVLIALLDNGHNAHAKAANWFVANADGWASCPITQLGVIRIMSQPSYPRQQMARDVWEALSLTAANTNHAFWPDDASLLEHGIVDWRKIIGHRQITDAYLLALAVKRGGKLVTFDRPLPLDAVCAATGEHVIALKA